METDQVTALQVARIAEIDRRDEQQMIAIMAGEFIDEYTYDFKDRGGRAQRGISYAGTREMAQMRGNIICGKPDIQDCDDHWRVMVQATDLVNNVSLWGGCHQPKRMKVNVRDNNGRITGEVIEQDDPFAFEKAIGKAQRNAIKNVMPHTAILKILDRLSSGNGGRSPKDVKQKGKGQSRNSPHAPRLDPAPSHVDIDPATIGDYTDFCKACHAAFNLQPAAALQLLGTTDKEAVADWPGAFRQVCAMQGAEIIIPVEAVE